MNVYLENNPLLLLFLIAAVGYLIGKVKIKGTGLGTSAVLFVGLAFGAYNPAFLIPSVIFEFGIVIFVYSIGLSSGPVFFQSFMKNGWRDIGFVLLMLVVSALMAIGLYWVGGFDKATIVGIYSGSTTNTTALASVIDIASQKASQDIDHLTIGYALSYPMGVLGVMLGIKILEKLFRIDYEKERKLMRSDYPLDDDLSSKTFLVTNPAVVGRSLRDIALEYEWNIVFGRLDSVEHGMILSNWDVTIHHGDKIMVVGDVSELTKVQEVLGEEAEHIGWNRKEYDVVRIFVSNPEVVGKSLASLNLQEKFSAIITRIRRGDSEMLAKPDTLLETGDRIRFVARRNDVKMIQKFFGDSYHAANKIDLFSFGVGICVGLLLGMVEWVLPGGISFKLGIAGGPLIAGLVLGALKRTGPIIWSLPYGANITLNQVGLTLLLAVIGVSAGHTLLHGLSGDIWVEIFLAGTILSVSGAIISIWIGYKIIKIPFSLLIGFVSNQPAILEFATDITKNKVPSFGYAFMFPISMVIKILFAQLLYIFL